MPNVISITYLIECDIWPNSQTYTLVKAYILEPIRGVFHPEPVFLPNIGLNVICDL